MLIVTLVQSATGLRERNPGLGDGIIDASDVLS
jgi:hypothetical protein